MALPVVQEQSPVENEIVDRVDGVSRMADAMSFPALDFVMHTLSQFLSQSPRMMGVDGEAICFPDVVNDVIRGIFEP